MNLFAFTRERLRRGKRQPDYCALVEAAVRLARSTADARSLLASLADEMGQALDLPRVSILLDSNGWKCGGEYSAAGLNTTARDKLRAIETELVGALSRETTPLQISFSDLQPPLTTALVSAFSDAPAGLQAQGLMFAPLRDPTERR